MDLETNDNTLSIIIYIIIIVSLVASLIFALKCFLAIKSIKLTLSKAGNTLSRNSSALPNSPDDDRYSIDDEEAVFSQSEVYKMYSVYEKIRNGAFSYIKTQSLFFFPFILLIASLIMIIIGVFLGFINGLLSSFAFLMGSGTSLMGGAAGMAFTTYANARTTKETQTSLEKGYKTAFTAATAFGIFLPTLSCLTAMAVLEVFKLYLGSSSRQLYTNFASFGFGSSVAGMFSRSSGGIYTKAADVGADMVGKVETNINEDDPRNPAVIADNVGDNVGDIAGMGADIYGSYGETMCSSLILFSYSSSLNHYSSPMKLPFLIVALSILVAWVSIYLSSAIIPHKRETEDIEKALKAYLLTFAIVMTMVALLVCLIFLPDEFNVARESDDAFVTTNLKAFFCFFFGIAGSLLVGLSTEYFTSNSFRPVRNLAQVSNTGPATVLISGIALGYNSVILPVIVIGGMVFAGYSLGEEFGIVMITLGALSFAPPILIIDAYGPICDNAGGIAEMAGLGEAVRDRTDKLDAAGNTTAAIGKGYGAELGYIVGTALGTSFMKIKGIGSVNLIEPRTLTGTALGVAIVFLFAGYLNNAVAEAAGAIVREVRRQFRTRDIIGGEDEPDYNECVQVATRTSLELMGPVFFMSLGTFYVGVLLGAKATAGYIFGVQLSGLPLAMASNNSGGAWDNAKKYIESGALGEGKGKNSENHYAAVIGDTVGDPMKDTSGPAINTFMKVTGISAVTFSSSIPLEPFFVKYLPRT